MEDEQDRHDDTARTPFSERLVSLDVLRGASIAAMLLVNNPGSWSNVYPPLRHASWHGWTFTDLIFPFFLFVVGVTTHLSLRRRESRGADRAQLIRTILARGTIIVLLGLALNAFPFFAWWDLPGRDDPSFVERVLYRFEHLRVTGVLQRIGLAYIAGAILALGASTRRLVISTATILIGYWAVMTLVPVPGTGAHGYELLDEPALVLSAWVDRTVLGNHLWSQTGTWDPEGLLSTIPAVATVLIGAIIGRLLDATGSLERRLARIYFWGSVLAAGGMAWNWFFPINKNLWTSSYVLFTAGVAALTLASIAWVTDVRGARGWSYPFVVFGVNPILAFVGSGLMARLIYSLIRVPVDDGTTIPLQQLVYRTAFSSWLPPRLASLGFAVFFVLLWLAILIPLHRRRIIFRV